MTADSNTPPNGRQQPEPWNPFGQESELQHHNPYVLDVLPGDQGPVPPEAASRKTRFSAAAITGMVLVSIVWAIVVRPLIAFTAWDVSDFSIFGFFAFSGLFTLLGGVTGFIAALIQGNKRLAARLYIIPSLIWQGAALAALFLLVVALSGYDGT